jgi:hypothetical protein
MAFSVAGHRGRGQAAVGGDEYRSGAEGQRGCASAGGEADYDRCPDDDAS